MILCREWPTFAALLLVASASLAVTCAAQTDVRDWQAERTRMVNEQLKARDIRNDRVLEAMLSVPRHRFIPESARGGAYGDFPVPIGYGQTISQPYIVAFMTQALDVGPGDRVLEIGTGSGYQAAVLSLLAREVFTIEIIESLADRARATLKDLGHQNVHVRAGNGYLGWPEYAPFDRIIVTAAPEAVPPALVEQLKIGGLMAIPIGVGDQELRILRRTPVGLDTIATLPVRFVPMTGKGS
jgi:protein-L-isoaspartate(D-aspartate) O-methyltransferase